MRRVAPALAPFLKRRRFHKPAQRVAVALLLLAAGGSGCARFESKPIVPAQSAALLEARRLDAPDLKRFLEANLHRELTTWPLASWDLPTLTLAAFFYHPSLEVARSQWGLSQAEVRTARGRPNPTVGLIPEYAFNPSSGVSPWLPALSLDVPVETAGKRGFRIAQTRHLAESARWNIAAAAWQVRSHLRSRLLEFAAAARREELLNKQLSLLENAVQWMEQRLAAGAIARPELTSMLMLRDKSRLELNQVRQQTAESRAGLAEAIGVPLLALTGLELVFDVASPPDFATRLLSPEIRQQALQARADVRGALAEYAAAQSALQLEIAMQYPDLHLGNGYQWDQGEHKWSLGLSLELPVLNRNQGPIAQAEARRAEAAARFTALQAKVISELDRAAAALHAAQEQSVAADSWLADQKRQHESIEAQLKAGAADQLDWLSSQIEVMAGESARLDSVVKAHQAFGTLEDAAELLIPPAILSALQRGLRPPDGKANEK